MVFSTPFTYKVSIGFPSTFHDFFSNKKITESMSLQCEISNKFLTQQLIFKIICENPAESFSFLTWQNAVAHTNNFISLGLDFELFTRKSCLHKKENLGISFLNLNFPIEKNMNISLPDELSTMLSQLELTERCAKNLNLLEEKFNAIATCMQRLNSYM